MNPAELARPYAEEILEFEFRRDFEDDSFELDRFNALTDVARLLDFVDRPFIVKAQGAVTFPLRDLSVEFTNVDFTGEFSGYDIVTPPRRMGRTAIRGLYMTFERVVMLSEIRMSESVIHVSPFSEEFVHKLAA